MAHFAKLNSSGVVIDVLVIADSDCLDADNNESEVVGIAFCKSLFGDDTIWKQTSYNHNMRKQYACIGGAYDASANEFVCIQPAASWTLDSDNDWQPPIALPSDAGEIVNAAGISEEQKVYDWDEDAYQADNSTGWVLRE
jgi:hypothetical protein|tara:strand:- start:64 stop:483 length:420 start_codon:yes stop_codon:yes gene_type:complete